MAPYTSPVSDTGRKVLVCCSLIGGAVGVDSPVAAVVEGSDYLGSDPATAAGDEGGLRTTAGTSGGL